MREHVRFEVKSRRPRCCTESIHGNWATSLCSPFHGVWKTSLASYAMMDFSHGVAHTRRHGTDSQLIETFLLLVCSLVLVVLQCLPLHSALLYGRRPGQPSSSSLARTACVQSPTSSSTSSSSTRSWTT